MKILKYIYKVASVLLVVTTLMACNALDLSPIDYYGSGNFWTTSTQVSGFMDGLHSQLRGSYSMFYVLGEARGGTLRSGTSSLNTSIDMSDPIKNNQFTKDKTGISNWNGIYNRVLQLNHFIDQVSNACPFLNENDRAYYLGQAHGLRAFYYSYLYRTFGGVPLITKVKVLDGKIMAEDLYTTRAKPSEVLSFIKEEIKKSEEYFGNDETGSNIKWNKHTTLMLKAEMYLWSAKVSTGDVRAAGKEDLLVAKNALTELEGKYVLLEDYSKIFTDKGNKEIIFSLRFKDNEATNWGANFVYSKDVFVGQRFTKEGEELGDVLDLKGNGLLRHEYKSSLWDTYDDKDKRRDKTFFAHYDKNGENQGLVLLKCLGIINSNGNRVYESDIIIYRYSDVLLMLAEVENALGNDGSKYINDVRKRAYGEDYSDEFAYKNASFEENELAILHERDKEFVWEGKRWFDVVRMQDENKESLVFSAKANYLNPDETTLYPILDKKLEAHKLLWPIDVNTLTNDPSLAQTPGYEE